MFSVVMEISIEHINSLLYITVSGRLDTATSALFDAQMAAELTHPQPRILVGLAGVTYVSSAGLRCVLRLIKHTAAHGGRLGLVATPPHIMEVVEISGFPGLVDIYADRATALAAHAA